MKASEAREIANNCDINVKIRDEIALVTSSVLKLIRKEAENGNYEIIIKKDSPIYSLFIKHMYKMINIMENLDYFIKTKCTKGMELDGYIIINWRDN